MGSTRKQKKEDASVYRQWTPEKKGVILLLREMFGLSNRKIAHLLSLFGSLTDTDICYKTIEWAYSGLPARYTIHNMFILLASSAGGNLNGDGTGYSLPITRHWKRPIVAIDGCSYSFCA